MPIQTTTLVSLLAWTYRDQRADLMSGDDLDRPPGATTRIDLPSELRLSGKGMTWDRVAENAASGCVIKTTAGRQRPALHPDAEVVHNAVLAVHQTDWQSAALVVQSARVGSIPDWASSPMSWEPAAGWGDNGRAATSWEETVTVPAKRGRPVEHRVLFTPVRPYPGLEWVEMCRAIYGAWYRGLEVVAARLMGESLQRWQVNGIGAEREPWTGEAG